MKNRSDIDGSLAVNSISSCFKVL